MKLLLGGSPCTRWSIAQTRNRETKPEGSGWELFRNYLIAKERYGPDYFLYENNKSMAPAIRAQITLELGVEPIMINSALVSAQSRQRLYWTNIPGVELPEDRGIILTDVLDSGLPLREKCYTLKANYGKASAANGLDGGHFPAPMVIEPVNITADGKAQCLRASYYKDGIRNMVGNTVDRKTCVAHQIPMCPIRVGTIESGTGSEGQGHRVYSADGKSKTLCGNGGGAGAKTGLYTVPVNCPNMLVREATRTGYAEISPGECVDLTMPGSKTRRGRAMREKANCLTTSCQYYQYCGTVDKPIYEVRDGQIIINGKKYPMHYNPFAYIHSEKDILKLVNTLIANTKGDGKGGDDFWVKAETLLYTALIGYIHYEAPVEEQNFATLIEFINALEVREDDEAFKNNVDLAFDELEEKDPNHFAVRQYKKYKLAAGKTAKSINISCGARLAPFDIQELREITMYDELELDTLGDKIFPPGKKDGDYQKTALFLIMSDTDTTFNFLISMIYTQLFNLLCEKADDVYGGRLPVHVRCLIDECANIGQIPNLEKLVATIRSREISACLVLQAQSQLKAIYKDNADTIIGNMDSRVFLGGSEPTTIKELNAALGKETIDTFNTSDTRGNSPSYGLSYQRLGHELMSQDEIAVMDGGKCILQLRGVRPFLSDKYDITKHPNYKYLSDADPRNAFDIEKFLSTQLRPRPEESYEVYEIDPENSEDEDTIPPFIPGL